MVAIFFLMLEKVKFFPRQQVIQWTSLDISIMFNTTYKINQDLPSVGHFLCLSLFVPQSRLYLFGSFIMFPVKCHPVKTRRYSRSRDKVALHPRMSARKVVPVPTPRKHKYSGKNSLFGLNHPCRSQFISPIAPPSSLNTKISSNLGSILSTGLADSSWDRYKTAYNHLKAVERDTGKDMSLPLSEETTLWYVSYLSTTRDISSKTIEGYLQGLKMLHLAVGISLPSLKSPLVKLALKGHDKERMLRALESTIHNKPHRRAITMELLKHFINFLHEKISSPFNMWAYYTCSVVAFFGSFRIGRDRYHAESMILSSNLDLKKSDWFC